MDLDKILDARIIRNVVDAAAAIKAVGFFLSFLIAGGGFLAYIVITQTKNDAALIGVSVAYLCLVVLLSFCIWYYVRHICDPEPYKIARLEGLLEVEQSGDHHHYRNTRKQVVRATRNNVRLIEVRSHWTGNYSKEKYHTESIVPEHALFDGRMREDDFRVHRWIYLRGPLGKRDEATVGVCQEWEDDLEGMRPYYRESGGRFKTRQLKVAIRFPYHEAPKRNEVVGFIWNANKRDRERREVARIDCAQNVDTQVGIVEFVVTVEKPKRYHSYGIRWRWPEGKAQI